MEKKHSAKIVQINTVYGTGSTGKIMASLYQLALSEGHDVYVVYGRGNAPSDTREYKIGNRLDFLQHVLINFFLGKSGFGSKAVTRRFLKWLDTVQPDLIHLHNIHGFYVHVGMLFKYIKQHHIPVIWTLHDCWPMTGQCAFFEYSGCQKWQTGCHHCPVYRRQYPYSLFKDNSRQNYLNKKNIFTDVPDMTIVTPCNWLADIVKQSYLREYPVKVVYNGIDIDLFKPVTPNRKDTRKIVLGVANVWEQRKGLKYFPELADMLDSTVYHIVLIGVNKKQQKFLQKKYEGRITALTRTSTQAELVNWYSSAYVYVNPTLEDNFPTTNLEALACGTPVITFNTGGSSESLTDKCGIVVEKGNTEQLKEAILSLEHRTDITSSSCREQALKFNQNLNFQEYLNLYSLVH
ncbi:MAG: glycosyltransferase [Lachnospiraceae bacterium]|nr:glycosyltransferase [Lachnospiraceae bacterium]